MTPRANQFVRIIGAISALTLILSIQISVAPKSRAGDIASSGLYINIDNSSFTSGSSVLTNLVSGKPNFNMRSGASGTLNPTSVNVSGQRNYFTTSATSGSAFAYIASGITQSGFGNTSSLSAFAWVYPTTLNHVVLEEKGSDYGSATWYDTQIEMVGGIYKFRVWGCSAVNSTSAPTQNAWHYVGFTYDGTTLKSYVDGTLQQSIACTRSVPWPDYNLYYGIGTNTGTHLNSAAYYGGFRFGALHIYNRGLTGPEVSSNYANLLNQSITLSSLGTSSKTYPYSQALTMSTTGSSGTGAITYAISAGGTASGCALSNSTSTATISATSSGTCLVTATIAADANFASATSSALTFTFNRDSQSALTVTSTSGTYGTPLSLTASGGSGGGSVSYSYSAGTTTCSLSGSDLSANGAGTCLITATKAADANYSSISSVQTTITFNLGISTTTISLAAGNLTFRQAKLVTVIVSSAGKVSVKVNNKTISGCKNLSATAGNSFTVTCIYRPSTHGYVNVSAIFTPTNAAFTSASASTPTYLVGARTGTR